jgi:hypothetical protein
LKTPWTWAHIEATYLLAQFHLKDLGDKDTFVRYLDVHKAADPLGISTARRVEASGLNSANELMRIWSRGHLSRLTELDEGKKDSLRKYQKYAGLLGKA